MGGWGLKSLQSVVREVLRQLTEDRCESVGGAYYAGAAHIRGGRA